jgi:hypothetical protein
MVEENPIVSQGRPLVFRCWFQSKAVAVVVIVIKVSEMTLWSDHGFWFQICF